MTFQRKRKSAANTDFIDLENSVVANTPRGEKRPRKEESKRTTSENQRAQQNLSSVRILQRNTCYVIGISPNIAKEETLRRFDYFG